MAIKRAETESDLELSQLAFLSLTIRIKLQLIFPFGRMFCDLSLHVIFDIVPKLS